MVKREPARITVGSAATVNALHDTRKSVKKNQAWRYPGGVIQRHTDTRINGRGPYTDDKDPGLPRRKQESNFFITLNTNRSCAGGGDLADVGKEAMRSTLNELSKDRMICQLLKFGPKNEKHYGADWYEDVIQKIEWNAAVELGENLDRLHCHIWLTVHHYSQVQVNMPVMQHLFKSIYNLKLVGSPHLDQLRVRGNPYMQVKLLPTSDWAQVMKQYIHKAMMANE